MKNKLKIFFISSLSLVSFLFAVSAFGQPKDLRTLRDDKQSDGYVGVALVIGNSDYQYATVLNSPVNDANDMAKTLKSLGFKVLPVRANATLSEMETAIAEFERELVANKGVGVFYYSGHGVQSKGLNYLIPVDVNIPTEAFLKQKAIDLESVMETMEGSTDNAKIIILDACRNDPFKSWRAKGDADKGLAKVDAPDGMLIAYATSPKKTAADGKGRNSPYTEILLNEIVTPNISITDMLQNVRTNLAKKTNKSQISWENTSLLGKFCFAGCNISANLNNSTNSTQTSLNNNECTDCIQKGPKYSKSSYYVKDQNNFRLYASIVSGNDNKTIQNEIDKLVAKEETHEWDNKWYFLTVANNYEGLLLLWKNITTQQYGWEFIQRNSNDIWFYKTNGTDWVKLETGKEDFTIWKSTPVKVYVKIPNLINGWNKEDIQYKFSY